MTATAALPARTLFRISPIDDTGVFLGLSMPQLIVGCGGALTGAITMVFVSVPLGALIVALLGGLALGRHTGEPVLHQLPSFARTIKPA